MEEAQAAALPLYNKYTGYTGRRNWVCSCVSAFGWLDGRLALFELFRYPFNYPSLLACLIRLASFEPTISAQAWGFLFRGKMGGGAAIHAGLAATRPLVCSLGLYTKSKRVRELLGTAFKF